MSTPVKVKKTLLLDPKKVRIVRKILRVNSDAGAVDMALDTVINDEIIKVHRKIRRRVNIKDIFGRCKD